MLTNILKSNQPFVIVFIFFATVLIWAYSFIEPVGIGIPTDILAMPFYNLISDYLLINSYTSLIATFILVLVQAFLLVQFNKKYILINYRTYLPAFFYILLSGSFVHLQRINPVIIGSLFIFVALNYIFSIYRAEYTLNRLYLAGFFISIAALFWAPFISFIIVLWISLLILRPFIGREWIVAILGYLTPFLFVFVYYFVFLEHDQLIAVFNRFIASFEVVKSWYALHYSYYIFYGLLTLIILFASYTAAANFQKKKIKTRKYFEINFCLFLTSLGLFVLLKNVTYEIIYLMSIPVSFLLTDYFYAVRKSWYLNLVLILLIGSIIYIQITAHY